MTTNNITSAQLSFLLSHLVGNNTYKIVDEPSNRFNFYGLTETIDSDAIEAIKSSNVSVYSISSDSIERVLSVYEDNDVNLNDYTYVLAIQHEDTITYMLVWGDLTYDVVFNNETNSNSKGFKSTFEDCERYITDNNRTLSSYFKDYKNGTVSIVCNETDETISEIDVVTPIDTEVKGFQGAKVFETSDNYLIDLRTGLGEAIYSKSQFSLIEAIADQVCSAIE